MVDTDKLTALLQKFRHEDFPLAVSVAKGDEARALYAFLRAIASGRETTIIATIEDAVRLLQEHESKQRKAAAGAANVNAASKNSTSFTDKAQASTFSGMMTKKRTLLDDSPPETPDPKRPLTTKASGIVYGEVPASPATPTPTQTRRRLGQSAVTDPPGTPGRSIDAFSSAQKSIRDAIAISPKRPNTRQNKGKAPATVPEVGESSKTRGAGQRLNYGTR